MDALTDTQKDVVRRAVEALADLERFHVHVQLRLSVDLCRALEGLHEMLVEEDEDE